MNKLIQENPLFTVIDEGVEATDRQVIRQQQHQNMKYFIGSSKKGITTNSSVVVAMLKAEGIVHRIDTESDSFPIGRVVNGAKAQAVDEAVNRGLKGAVEGGL